MPSSTSTHTFPPVRVVPAHSPLAYPWCGQLDTRIKLRPGDTIQISDLERALELAKRELGRA